MLKLTQVAEEIPVPSRKFYCTLATSGKLQVTVTQWNILMKLPFGILFFSIFLS
ncbi:hypothetical protein K493DRAFT_360537 [Basidiobolus meristosporus CBS 931.73]|uniref:Uncharacterized protein n=1 Tax=Basidiobolus meristosporus CBS 931.73 TaxID=1314790 RepID=A0A1Y1XH15_9FUNG|nr:hypothetical protein K493DRAFT_360537 [Basidiobolus meristosporus CBS 931.73]|eukprot:ORX85049.1 hypothetical protein K493DRAFT_360537 [Basidiobolus meristosporus CBS 931.73]